MKIVDIRTTPLSYRCDPAYGSAGGMQARRGGLLVEIETDERVIGIGEAGVGGGITRDVIDKLLQPMLIGEDPLLIEGLWQKMFARTRQFGRRGIVMNAISGIDIALWDIAGKVANLPLYRLLGGCRDRSRRMPAAVSTRRASRSTILPARPRGTALAASKA